jgi:hypothetical protein
MDTNAVRTRVTNARRAYDARVMDAERDLAECENDYREAVKLAEGNLELTRMAVNSPIASFRDLTLYPNRVESKTIKASLLDSVAATVTRRESTDSYIVVVKTPDALITTQATAEQEEEACRFADLVASQGLVARTEEERRMSELGRLEAELEEVVADRSAIEAAKARRRLAYASTDELDEATALLEHVEPDISKSELDAIRSQERRESVFARSLVILVVILMLAVTVVLFHRS